MKKLIYSLTLLVTVLFAGQAFADTYTVYCANGKIEVDTRTLGEMKSARGSNVYAMVSYDYLTDANNFAKKHGGVGATCPKK